MNERELRQVQVADQLGVSQSRVSRYLNGGLPAPEKVPGIAAWLDVPVETLEDYLLRRYDRPALQLSNQDRLLALAEAQREVAAAMAEVRAELARIADLIEHGAVLAQNGTTKATPRRGRTSRS